MSASLIFEKPAVSPALELGAYEELWAREGQSFKRMADLFRKSGNDLPSRFVNEGTAMARAKEVLSIMLAKHVNDAGFIIQGTIDYPPSLQDAKHPVQFLYYRGSLDLLSMPLRVAIVGTRNPTEEGIKRTRKLTKSLVSDGAVIVSGLAKGIDTAAHSAAIQLGGMTIGVIGTPITESYPKENAALQEQIAREHLLVSQVPIIRYSQQTPMWNKVFFPERNATMSALTDATIIVEAGETSGSLIQGRAAIHQGRKLFILDSCFTKGLKWPERLQAQGAIRVTDYDDIKRHLVIPPHQN